MSFVLHHDLQADVKNAYQAILKYHRLVPEAALGQVALGHAALGSASSVQIITPMNMS